MREASHKIPHIVRFRLYEISQVRKSIKTESRLVIAWDCAEGGTKASNGFGDSFGGDGIVLKLYTGDGCITL